MEGPLQEKAGWAGVNLRKCRSLCVAKHKQSLCTELCGWMEVCCTGKITLHYDTLPFCTFIVLKQGSSAGAHFTYSRPQLDSDSSSPSEGRDFVQVGQGPFRSDSPTLDDYVVVPPEIPSDCSGTGNLILSASYPCHWYLMLEVSTVGNVAFTINQQSVSSKWHCRTLCNKQLLVLFYSRNLSGAIEQKLKTCAH